MRKKRPSGVQLIALERSRQVRSEKFSAKHDNEHDRGELASAAICYAAVATGQRVYTKSQPFRDSEAGVTFSDPWPWEEAWDKRENNDLSDDTDAAELEEYVIDLLVKAGALIAAEIDRRKRRRVG